MAHKVVTLRRRNRKERGAAYVETDIPFSRSISQIKEMLDRYGCDKILEFTNKSGEIVQNSLAFEFRGAKFLIEFPITYLQGTKGNPPKLDMNISGRIIYNKIKALLVDVEIEYLDFSQAMVPFMLLPTPSGRPTTVTDILTLEDAATKARSVQFLLGSGSQ